MSKLQQISEVYACLPFVELAHENSIEMGPILFWPASKFSRFIPEEYTGHFQNFLDAIVQIKTHHAESGKLINTIKLSPSSTTFISISPSVPTDKRDTLLIDALYLLYFACTFRDLYKGSEIPPFGAFRKMIPASLPYIQFKPCWEHHHIAEMDREQTVCLHLLDPPICKSFGKMLTALYEQEKNPCIEYPRTVRAIRYLVDRFFPRFVNLFKENLSFPEILFEPEDVIFLASGFESLFDIQEKDPAADFKHKVRPLLHIKYSKPVEIFWKWVNDFYEVRRKIVHGGENPGTLFKLNPNFEISHLSLGIKLFIYSIYHFLHTHHLLHTHSSKLNPPDFKWIHPDDILLFFWTESTLLKKLCLFVERHDPLLYNDIEHLAKLFTTMQEIYFINPNLTDTKFIPTPIQELEPSIHHLLRALQKADSKLHKYLPTRFEELLRQRIEKET